MMRVPTVRRRSSAAVVLAGGLWIAGALQPVQSAGFRFIDATAESGIDSVNVCGAAEKDKRWLSESLGTGAAWLDYNNDGNLDLYIVNGSTYDRKPGAGEPNQLFRGNGKGSFTDVTRKAGVGDRGWGYGVTVGDIDNDGDSDIYVTNFGPNVLYRNDGDGTFTDITQRAGVGNDLLSTSAAFLDYDGDGRLDLYVGSYMLSDPKKVPARGTQEARAANCIYKGIDVACGPLGMVPLQDALYRNKGDGIFEDATRAAGVWLEKPRFTLGVAAADFNNDGWTDLYVANDSVQNSLWRNNRNGTFTDIGVTSLAALNADGQSQAGMGTDFGDFNGDGWLDLVVTNFAHDLNTVYRNLGGKIFIDDSAMAGMAVTYLALSWGTGFIDFDLDGDEDLLIANGHVYAEVAQETIGTSYKQRNHLFRNDGGRFAEVGAASGPGLAIEKSFRGAAFGDYDNDGDVDVFLTSLGDRGVLLRNDSDRLGNWASIRLIGGSANRDGVGAAVTVTAGGRKFLRQVEGGGSYLSASDRTLHFGLGAAERIDSIEIVWPGGQVQQVEGGIPNRSFAIRQEPQ